VKQAFPLIILCSVSLRFNVLDGALLGGVSDKRGPQSRSESGDFCFVLWLIGNF
jgi:hypothetical protein